MTTPTKQYFFKIRGKKATELELTETQFKGLESVCNSHPYEYEYIVPLPTK